MSRQVGRIKRKVALLVWAALGIALATTRTALGAPTPMLFSRLDSDSGLSQGTVLAIAQDAAGFVWLGTEDGLNRFDGHEVLHVVHDRAARSSLPVNWVSALATGTDGRLWIGTGGGGVVWRDPADARLHAPVSQSGHALLDPQIRVRALHMDVRGRLWIATADAGLKVIDPAAGTAREFRRDRTDPDSLSDDSVFDVTADPSGIVWVATARGFDRLEPASGRVLSYADRLRNAARTRDVPVPVSVLTVDARGTVWAGTNVGLARLDPISNQLNVLAHDTSDPQSLPDNRVTAILEDSANRLWIGTVAGLALLDRQTNRFSVFRHDPADSASLPEDHVVTLFEDASGLLWVGTKSRGVARWNPRSWSFGHRLLGTPGGNNVSAFAEDAEGTLWVGSLGGGLVALDRRSGKVRHYAPDVPAPYRIGDANVMAIATDTRGGVWLGTMQAGVERLDPATGQIRRFVHDPADSNSLSASGVMSLLSDSRGRIWVGTYGGGLNMIDPASGRVTRYPAARGDGGGLSGTRATALAEDRAGMVWIGTDGAGLHVLDPATGRLQQFRHVPDVAGSLADDSIYAVHVDERGRVWIGTRGGGLDRAIGSPFAQPGLQFQNYAEAQGLPNTTVYGIESDAAGALWLSTNRGLARLDPGSGEVRAFRHSHGLQADEFNFGAHYRSPAGELLFGGPNGFNAFYAERLRFNDRAPPVVLTGFQKFNADFDAGVPYDRLESLNLPHRDEVITFKFAALDYAAPAQNRYAYMLEGFDRDWVKAGDRRQATYTNLGGGKYVFRVRASNSDGVWNTQGLAVRLHVDPPPWATWWALSAYVVCLLGLLSAVWGAQQRKIVREAAYARELEEQVTARTQELAARNVDLETANQRLREASITDPLTGLANRRGLTEHVQELVTGSNRESVPDAGAGSFVLMVVDLDHLKSINDRHGHDGGDRVLVQVAGILRRLCRTHDRIVRWGGDEFVILCRDATFQTAEVLAERVRSAVAKQIFRVDEGTVARTSCSIGFAPHPFVAAAPTLLGWEQSLALADSALFQAKRDRNTWVGWAGTGRTAELAAPLQELERDPQAMETGGYLAVVRRPLRTEDTVDHLRASRGPVDR